MSLNIELKKTPPTFAPSGLYVAGLLAATLLVSGCQTTGAGSSNPNLDPADVSKAQNVIAKGCVVGNSSNPRQKGIDPNNVIVFGIDKGKNGWVRVDSKVLGATRMMRSNVYYSFELKKMYCGDTSWQNSGLNSSEIF